MVSLDQLKGRVGHSLQRFLERSWLDKPPREVQEHAQRPFCIPGHARSIADSAVTSPQIPTKNHEKTSAPAKTIPIES
jgi:hypothetical protein